MSARPGSRFRAGNRWIGAGEPCCLVAEAGSNHNGSLEQARALIDGARAQRGVAEALQGVRIHEVSTAQRDGGEHIIVLERAC